MPKIKEESQKSGRGWYLTGAIILFLIFVFSYFFNIGYYFGFRYLGIAFLIAAIALLITYFSTEGNKKVYKENLPPKEMKIQYVFYTVGVLFIFASVWYFTREFIDDLPDPIKLTLLIVAVVISFIIAELLRGADK